MKSIVIHAAKDLRIEDCGDPEPGLGEVQVALAAGGICGSDLHYYLHGGFGAIRLREPMILGHEVSGHITKLGDGVTGLRVGQLVAISPSRPCYQCTYCTQGMHQQCMQMRFYGSAMPFPHVQGAFREGLVADARQCVPADGLTPGEAAMAEPLAVVLHATRRAGEMLGTFCRMVSLTFIFTRSPSWMDVPYGTGNACLIGRIGRKSHGAAGWSVF